MYTFTEVKELWIKNAVIGVSYPWAKELISLSNHFDRALGDKYITEIKPDDIDSLIKELSKKNPNTNKPASKRLLKLVADTARRIFEYAVDNGYIEKNPARKSKKQVPKNAPKKVVNGLSDLQQKIVAGFSHRAKLAIVLMMLTGLRTGELLALEWSDIDFESNTLSVNKRCCRTKTNYYEVIPGTKNGKTRCVPIPESIIGWLEEQLLLSDSSLVVPNKKGNLHTPSTWKRMWQSYQCDLNYQVYYNKCKKRGIAPKNKYSPTGIPDMGIKFNAHQLRHTYATMLYLSGVDVLTAKELLGHCDIKTTLGIYTHLEEKFKKLNIIKFDQYIQSELLNAASL